MITAMMAKVLVDTGLNAPCAWCEHYHNSMKNASGREFDCGKTECGGPTSGKVYPSYKGPLNDLTGICFICGMQSDAAIEVKNKGFVGVCEKHIPTFKQLIAHPGAPPPIVAERTVFVAGTKKEW